MYNPRIFGGMEYLPEFQDNYTSFIDQGQAGSDYQIIISSSVANAT